MSFLNVVLILTDGHILKHIRGSKSKCLQLLLFIYFTTAANVIFQTAVSKKTPII